ncbi:CLUMA_CG013763, isoform A [Clunio marinus]|uniref:CLUMA_CG013763, isoform A n=1 Tax=Clunio marinus TaxID=568069 RepID=A0A1J1IN30_9DIPT|nr:CLUMA_CG013763, isoform A [Clunio marinus]
MNKKTAQCCVVFELRKIKIFTNTPPKCLPSFFPADSPRSKFKHFHFAVFWHKAVEEEYRTILALNKSAITANR